MMHCEEDTIWTASEKSHGTERSFIIYLVWNDGCAVLLILTGRREKMAYANGG